ERAYEERARQQRLPRAADAARERPRLLRPPAQTRPPGGGSAALPRGDPHGSGPAGDAPERPARPAADRARRAGARPRGIRPERAPARADDAVLGAEHAARAVVPAGRQLADRGGRPRPARPGARQSPLERDQVLAG